MNHRVFLPLLTALSAGCVGYVKPATGILQGIHQPVLLTPVDRLGGGKPLPTRQVGEYEGQAEAFFAQSSHQSVNYQVTVTHDVTDNTGLAVGALKALADKGPQADIRLTTVRTRSYGWPTGIKSRVYAEGVVVLVGEKP